VNFTEIDDSSKVFPGEYLLYSPTQSVVLCGAFNREQDFIRAYGNGKYIEDKIVNFKKIELERKEQKQLSKNKRCGGCKGR
tara:strand:- start:962 stop:1204 length:243 start_codon:yes stop_codon:yes gene_type:complete